jgi:hypothetical protein
MLLVLFLIATVLDAYNLDHNLVQKLRDQRETDAELFLCQVSCSYVQSRARSK